jgi:hypothetical protein
MAIVIPVIYKLAEAAIAPMSMSLFIHDTHQGESPDSREDVGLPSQFARLISNDEVVVCQQFTPPYLLKV